MKWSSFRDISFGRPSRRRNVMASPRGVVRVHVAGVTVTFQAEGQATMHECMALKDCAEQALAEGCNVFHVDLRRCTYMDSTFMGTLLFLARAAKKAGGAFAVVSPSACCQRLLHELVLDKLFPAVEAEEIAAGAWTELDTGPGETQRFNMHVVRAHQELAALGGPVGEKFQRVVQCFERDLQTHRS